MTNYNELLTPNQFLLFNIARQLKHKHLASFTDQHDYPHLLQVMKNVQMLINVYPETHEYWRSAFGSLYKAKKFMSLGAFAHDLLRGYGSETHGELFFDLWKKGLVPDLFKTFPFEIVQAIKRHSNPLPKNYTHEDVFLKTADSLDVTRYGYKVDPKLLPLQDAQERISNLKDFKFIDFTPKEPEENIEKLLRTFNDLIWQKEAKKIFRIMKQRKTLDPVPPKVNDPELEQGLELLRAIFLKNTYDALNFDNVKKLLKEKYPNHNIDNCPTLKPLKELSEAWRNDAVVNHSFSYGLKYLYEIKDYLPKRILARHIIYHYVTDSHPMLSIGSKRLVEMLESCKKEMKQYVMDKEGKEIYSKLPKIIKVYRGFTEITKADLLSEFIFGVSWAGNKDIARSFATGKNLFGLLRGYILEGIINKKDIYLLRSPTGFDDYELFLNPYKIKNLKIIETIEPKTQFEPIEDVSLIDLEHYKNVVKKFFYKKGEGVQSK